MSVVLKCGILNLLEPSGPFEACNEIALPFNPAFKLTGLTNIFVNFECDDACVYNERLGHFHTFSDCLGGTVDVKGPRALPIQTDSTLM